LTIGSRTVAGGDELRYRCNQIVSAAGNFRPDACRSTLRSSTDLKSAMTNRLGHPISRSGANGGDEALQRAMFALNSGRPGEAERIVTDVLKANPRHILALQVMGGALQMQNRIADAIAPLEMAARGNHDPRIETMLGIALRQADRIEDALSCLRRAVKRRPPHGPAFYELGRLLLFVNRNDEAIEAFSSGLEIAPMMPELAFQLGFGLFGRGKYAAAKAAFERALSISPGAAPPLFGLAKVHLAIGENAAAAGYFRRYLASQPNDADAWLHLGYCLLEMGDRDACQECFRTATRGAPQNYGHVLAALVKSGRGQFWLRPSAAARYFQE
jgi:tetratricopeptide (TPR) repeat protein